MRSPDVPGFQLPEGEKSESPEFKQTVTESAEVFRELGLIPMANFVLSESRISPRFVARSRPEFDEMRQRLNTEGGIIISNHPGFVDTPSIVSALERTDIKIFSGQGGIDRFGELMGDKHLIRAGKDIASVRNFLVNATKHVNNGGLFLIYPSGLHDSREFRAGFHHLVERVNPESLVYMFKFNEQQSPVIYDAMNKFIKIGVRPKENLVIDVDEKLSRANEWQQLINQISDREDIPSVATEYYYNHFV